MDVKSALEEAGGDRAGAVDILRKKGLAARAKKAQRAANEGLVYSYIHAGGKIGVLVEINCETDFVARTEDFQALAREVAMHIAAAAPLYVTEEDIPTEALEKEREIARDQALNEGKPENIVDKIVEGRLEKYKQEVVLLNQGFIKNPDQTVGDVIADYIGKLGENIKVSRFTRYVLGE